MLKNSFLRGFLVGVIAILAIAAYFIWRAPSTRPAGAPQAAPAPAPAPARPASLTTPAATAPAVPVPATASVQSADCASPAWNGAAAANKASLYTLAWSPFGKAETGWATYVPLISREIGAHCPADSPGFAAAWSRWQAAHGFAADGIVKPPGFERLRDILALRRPFVKASAKGACPAAPDPAALATASPSESFGGKTILLRPGALAAYRRMVAAARAAGVAARPPLFQLVSGFRGPAEEASRCAGGGCNTLTRASCSAHRTGLAFDLYLDPLPGADPTSTDEANRRHMSASVEYRWLVANASRFGFLPYAYEPWHWEWTGEGI
ncbi:MAG TPA: M15 family metallopeptidase [Caulobacteraceae bacterium]|nr:M15 family metallopeptidase [Caulobacteraceae bacterium]